jgi:transposase
MRPAFSSWQFKAVSDFVRKEWDRSYSYREVSEKLGIRMDTAKKWLDYFTDKGIIAFKWGKFRKVRGEYND